VLVCLICRLHRDAVVYSREAFGRPPTARRQRCGRRQRECFSWFQLASALQGAYRRDRGGAPVVGGRLSLVRCTSAGRHSEFDPDLCVARDPYPTAESRYLDPVRGRDHRADCRATVATTRGARATPMVILRRSRAVCSLSQPGLTAPVREAAMPRNCGRTEARFAAARVWGGQGLGGGRGVEMLYRPRRQGDSNTARALPRVSIGPRRIGRAGCMFMIYGPVGRVHVYQARDAQSPPSCGQVSSAGRGTEIRVCPVLLLGARQASSLPPDRRRNNAPPIAQTHIPASV